MMCRGNGFPFLQRDRVSRKMRAPLPITQHFILHIIEVETAKQSGSSSVCLFIVATAPDSGRKSRVRTQI